MSWLRPCLSVDPASRPTVRQLLQQPFFLRLAAQEYLHAVAQQEAEERAAQEGGGAAAVVPPPWFARPESPPRDSGSSSSWEGLPPLTPQVIPAPYSTPRSSGPQHSHTDALPQAGSGSEPPPSVRIASSDGLYSHLDPDVVMEMERLQMIDR